VRRAKLYYLRDRVGKRARVRERRYTGPEEMIEPGLLHESAGATDADGMTAEETVGEGVQAAGDGVDAGAQTAGVSDAQQPDSDADGGDRSAAPSSEVVVDQQGGAPASAGADESEQSDGSGEGVTSAQAEIPTEGETGTDAETSAGAESETPGVDSPSSDASEAQGGTLAGEKPA
jgi:hypothetical protein